MADGVSEVRDAVQAKREDATGEEGAMSLPVTEYVRRLQVQQVREECRGVGEGA